MEHMDHGGMAGLTAAPPGKIPHPDHGTWEGHVLPGSFFVVWSLWWLFSIFRLHFRATAKRPFRSRAWFEFPAPGSRYPVEPALKILLPLLGIVLELWLGHVSYRRLYDPQTGRFEQGNLQDWQHSAMYAAFICSGIADLAGHYTAPGTLPPGTEHGFLGLAFLVEGLLFAFHLKGTALDWKLHFLLVLLVLAGAAACFAEAARPGSALLAALRAQLTLLQGLWFYQIAQILFRDNPAWDPTTHGAVMMVPFFFVLWLLVVALASLAVFVGVAVWRQRRQAYGLVAQKEDGAWGSPGSNGGRHALPTDLELGAQNGHRN